MAGGAWTSIGGATCATRRLWTRGTTQGTTRLERASFAHDRLGRQIAMTRYLDPDAASGGRAVMSQWHYDSLDQLLELDEPDSVPQLHTYSDWGELIETRRNLTGKTSIAATQYDALGRVVHREQRDNGTVDPDTVNDYLYDQPVDLAPQVTMTHVAGRLAQAISPTGAVALSYDSLGQVNARVFTDPHGGTYVEQRTLHADGTPSALDLYLPDTGFADEHVAYGYDSAGRGTSVTYQNGATPEELFHATAIDPFGRVREARYGGVATYTASYADVGRRLLHSVSVSSAKGSRAITYGGFDPLGRERARTELKDAEPTAAASSFTYDALGRLATATRTGGSVAPLHQQYTYDPLGNLRSLIDTSGAPGAASTTISYLATDRDRICRIGYAGDAGTACNVGYDELGNIVDEPTRTGTRQLGFLADGNVRSIDDATSSARFRYDAFGAVQELDLTSTSSPDVRHDRRYGDLIAWRDQRVSGALTSVLSRTIPGPDGLVATRKGAGGPWLFTFGEARGTRFFTDDTGGFVQDVDYTPFGEVTSTGAPPGDALYSSDQWNGGDGLAAFGLAHLGARLYDPAIGRFLSRDPLLIPRTAATTNPYAFAVNDPINAFDPSGLDPEGGPTHGGDGSPDLPGITDIHIDTGGGDGKVRPSQYPHSKGEPLPAVAARAQLLAQIGQAALQAEVNQRARNQVSFGSLARNCAADLVETCGTVAGGLAGAATGTFVTGGPWGAPVGGFVGAGLGRGAVYPLAQLIRGEDSTIGDQLTAAANGATFEMGGQVLGKAIGYIVNKVRRVAAAANAGRAIGRGGIGPVLQGKAGVERAIADLEAAGGRVLGREVTIEAGGIRTRIDLYVELPNGQKAFLEIKTGPFAGLTSNQSATFPLIWAAGGVPFGNNARLANLALGAPIGPTPVWVIYLPFP